MKVRLASAKRAINTFRINVVRLLQRRLQRTTAAPRPGPQPPGPPRVDFSYSIYWTKHVRTWDAARRAAVHEALLRVLGQPGFEVNAYERRYHVPGLDEQAHSGASLVALKRVLAAFENEG